MSNEPISVELPSGRVTQIRSHMTVVAIDHLLNQPDQQPLRDRIISFLLELKTADDDVDFSELNALTNDGLISILDRLLTENLRERIKKANGDDYFTDFIAALRNQYDQSLKPLSPMFEHSYRSADDLVQQILKPHGSSAALEQMKKMMGPGTPMVLEQMKKMQEPPPTLPNLFPRHFPSAEERLLDNILNQQNEQFRENQEVQLQIAQTLKQLITDTSNATKVSNRFSTWVVIIAGLTLLASVFFGVLSLIRVAPQPAPIHSTIVKKPVS